MLFQSLLNLFILLISFPPSQSELASPSMEELTADDALLAREYQTLLNERYLRKRSNSGSATGSGKLSLRIERIDSQGSPYSNSANDKYSTKYNIPAYNSAVNTEVSSPKLAELKPLRSIHSNLHDNSSGVRTGSPHIQQQQKSGQNRAPIRHVDSTLFLDTTIDEAYTLELQSATPYQNTSQPTPNNNSNKKNTNSTALQTQPQPLLSPHNTTTAPKPFLKRSGDSTRHLLNVAAASPKFQASHAGFEKQSVSSPIRVNQQVLAACVYILYHQCF